MDGWEGGVRVGGCICLHIQRLPGSASGPYGLRREGDTQADPDWQVDGGNPD